VKHARLVFLASTILGTAPIHADIRAHVQNQPMRIVLVGDSTVTDGSGWGTGFRRLVSDAVEVVNTAANGRSSKSFIDEGRWATALAKRGQYYLIQFGHNDEPGKGPERETDPNTTYRSNMTRYVDDARSIGAKPILVTSLVRRLYKEDGTIRTTQTPYVEVVRAIAAEKRVPLVDLHAISLADAEHAGDEVWADLSPRVETGDGKEQIDRTHLNPKGSEVVGRMVVDALRAAAPELAPFLRMAPATEGAVRPIAAPQAGEAGFTQLFNGKDLSGWIYGRRAGGAENRTGKGYQVENGVLFTTSEDGGNLYTEKEYGDFTLRFEFRLTENANNGIGIRAPLEGDAAYAGIEIQVLDDGGSQYKSLRPAQYHGSVYDMVAAKRGFQKPVGEWNTEEITARGRQITVVLNGTTIVDANLDDVKDEATLAKHRDLSKPEGSRGIANTKGHIGLLGHGTRVEFRNIRIKEQ
jgi:lysophospholipase L1-like esterase